MAIFLFHWNIGIYLPIKLLFLQDVAENMLAFFTSPLFFKMFVQIDEFRATMDACVRLFLCAMPQTSKLCPILQSRDSEDLVHQDAYKKLEDTCERITKILRFLGVLLNSQKVTVDIPLNSKDVLAMVSYKGKQFLEKSFLDAVQNNQRIRSLCDEVVRTASSSVTMGPVKERALSTLMGLQDKTLELTAERLDGIIKDVPRLRKGLREVEMEEFNKIAVQLISEKTRNIIDGDTPISSISSRFMGVLLEGLSVYKDLAGTTDLHDRLQQWSNQHRLDTALCDLMDSAKVWLEEKGCVADLTEVSDLMGKLKKVKVDTNVHEQHFAAAVMLVGALRSFNTEAGATDTILY